MIGRRGELAEKLPDERQWTDIEAGQTSSLDTTEFDTAVGSSHSRDNDQGAELWRQFAAEGAAQESVYSPWRSFSVTPSRAISRWTRSQSG